MTIRERVGALRGRMVAAGLAAYIIPSGDPHQSEYPPEHWKARQWISGFAGSAGTVVVTGRRAGLWTDFRYFSAAEAALSGTGIELFRHGEPEVPDYEAWLATELSSGDSVGVDAFCYSLEGLRKLAAALDPKGIVVRPGDDLIDTLWDDRPALPAGRVVIHDVKYAGASRGEKISALREQMRSLGADYHLICTLDDIAWLLNIRGSDVEYNPVVVCSLLAGLESMQLFIDPRKLDRAVRSELESDGVAIEPYESFAGAVDTIEGGAAVVSPGQVSAGIVAKLKESVRRIEKPNLTTIAKARKNASELDHLRRAMVRDGVAMVRFLKWLASSVGDQRVTELSAERRLRELRSEGSNYVSESFRTISAYRGHAALPHYAATEESDVPLQQAGLYLVDSGAQYTDGTTDITRTVALGEPTEEERRDFTLVLKGHVALATMRHPAGVTGQHLDAIARQFLWRSRLNYGHGTGHGVGFHLNVHEGPQRISPHPSDVALAAGMVTSNEPGIYRPGRHGVRIENLVVTVEDERTEFGLFHRFETLTLCPIDRTLIDRGLLSTEERKWVDEYHRRVRDSLLGHLKPDVARWLEDACAPLPA